MTSELKIKKIAGMFLPGGTGTPKKLFFSIDILLLALILMLCAAMFQKDNTTGSDPETAYAALDQPAKTEIAKPNPLNLKLDDYRIIWERNLFNTSKEANPVSKDEFSDAKIVLAKKDMGLELVGTVVGNDPDWNRAFIFNQKTGLQGIYQTGDRVDIGLIKKILRSEVFISNENSAELLVFRVKDFPTLSETSVDMHQTSGNLVAFQQASAWKSLRRRGGSVVLTREEIKASLIDMDKKLEQFEISPFVPGEKSLGFRVGNIIPDSIFDKLGLRYGEAITAVNGETIAGPNELLQKLKNGGKVTIKVQKSKYVRRRTRFIHLDIG